jgi:hypothetical protein
MAMRAPARGPRARSRFGRLLSCCTAAGACALLAAACGSTPAPGSGASSTSAPNTGPSATGGPSSSPSAASSSGPATTATAKTSLVVSFSGSPTIAAAHYTLTCDPAGGTVTDPATACARLLRGTSLFGPLPRHVACPMIMVDAGNATVTGRYFGRPVHETIVDGGCDLSRWAKLREVFR